MPSHPSCAKHTFRGYTGYLISPTQTGHQLLAVRHSALVSPWVDPDVHLHETAEEIYILIRGELWFLVAGSLVTLRPGEILAIRPQIPHAIVQGKGPIEHLGLRAPALNDRQTTGKIPSQLSVTGIEDERELRCDWGYRIPLKESRNQNRWLLGHGTARFHTQNLILAYLDFPTPEMANAGIGTRHRLHLHRESWEYYTVLEGAITKRVEDRLLTVEAGEILEVPSGVRHTLHSRQAPYRGFTFRVPILGYDDKFEHG
jgi:mannose-6-phosphate isomerase-like protein (cupin superfamily)